MHEKSGVKKGEEKEMQAIILAAGMGKRLKELTQNNTKCMVKVNGVTMIERMLRQIDARHFSRIVIVVGYEGKKLMDFISTLKILTPVVFVENKIYDKTNNIYSLSLAKEFLRKEDTVLFESDIIFEDSVLDSLLEDPRETLALVAKYESWMDGTCVKLSENDDIIDFVPGKKFDFSQGENYFKTVNIYKFSRHFSESHYVPFLEAYQEALGENEYYEQVLRVITMLDEPGIFARRLENQKWYEIDDAQDLDIAESIFASDEKQKLHALQKRYGGYWRYPALKDFCYLVNPYFPPEKLMDEIRASFEKLIAQYPSGMQVNSLVAAKNFGVRAENIIVGNGAAELIKSLLNFLEGRIGIVRPTFEEYPARCSAENVTAFFPETHGMNYSAEDLKNFFDANPVENLILINPDNPSGNYIKKSDLLNLVSWTKAKKINFVVDESFADFSDEKNNSLIDMNLLNENPHLFVMKSISKSYGVPGLRLGILASGAAEKISLMKKDVSIWNINSFAEFYMQISEKYKKDYEAALEKFRAERKRFESVLNSIDGIKIFPSQANYFMAEISGIPADELAARILSEDEILIKDLTQKIRGKNFVRIAIKTAEENDCLAASLKRILQTK
jgi:histidinol-phosphate/aromatic aminotransferase/cobyric acid decarboxylase-like protein/choline kinase